MHTTILLVNQAVSTPLGYIIGAVISLFILGYLLYSLIKPEKF
jgi:K+-transporting ATPase KdpF subunit